MTNLKIFQPIIVYIDFFFKIDDEEVVAPFAVLKN